MKKLIFGSLALIPALAVATACGSGNDQKKKAEANPPVTRTAVDVARKASVTSAPGPVPVPVTPATAGARPDEADKARGVRLALVLGEGKGGFAFNAVTLSAEARAKIDELMTGGKVDLAAALFEVEGHTDNLGRKAVNERIGLARAEAVRLYLSERYEIPMDRISVISYGFDRPVADNATEDGRALNRRVVLKVLDPAGALD